MYWNYGKKFVVIDSFLKVINYIKYKMFYVIVTIALFQFIYFLKCEYKIKMNGFHFENNF